MCGGKEGVRRRMYQPRSGRCIVQSVVDVALSYGLRPHPEMHGEIVQSQEGSAG